MHESYGSSPKPYRFIRTSVPLISGNSESSQTPCFGHMGQPPRDMVWGISVDQEVASVPKPRMRTHPTMEGRVSETPRAQSRMGCILEHDVYMGWRDLHYEPPLGLLSCMFNKGQFLRNRRSSWRKDFRHEGGWSGKNLGMWGNLPAPLSRRGSLVAPVQTAGDGHTNGIQGWLVRAQAPCKVFCPRLCKADPTMVPFIWLET